MRDKLTAKKSQQNGSYSRFEDGIAPAVTFSRHMGFLLICCVVCGVFHGRCCCQVLLSTATCCWGLTSSARLVVIMGTQFYDGTGLGASDYPVTDLLQMLGRASRPGVDEVRGQQDVGVRVSLLMLPGK